MTPNRREFEKQCTFQKFCKSVLHNEALEGYTKFLFLNRNGLPKVAVNYESMFRGL